MNKAYVVSYTEYDFSDVRAVFETEELAERYISTYPQNEARRLYINCVPMFYKED